MEEPLQPLRSRRSRKPPRSLKRRRLPGRPMREDRSCRRQAAGQETAAVAEEAARPKEEIETARTKHDALWQGFAVSESSENLETTHAERDALWQHLAASESPEPKPGTASPHLKRPRRKSPSLPLKVAGHKTAALASGRGTSRRQAGPAERRCRGCRQAGPSTVRQCRRRRGCRRAGPGGSRRELLSSRAPTELLSSRAGCRERRRAGSGIAEM